MQQLPRPGAGRGQDLSRDRAAARRVRARCRAAGRRAYKARRRRCETLFERPLNTEAQRALAARSVTHDDGSGVLSEWLAEFPADNDADLHFCLQLLTDPDAMPIESASAAWGVGKSARRRAVTRNMRERSHCTSYRRIFGDDTLALGPCASRPDLRPLGSTGRAHKLLLRHLVDVFKQQGCMMSPPWQAMGPRRSTSPG